MDTDGTECMDVNSGGEQVTDDTEDVINASPEADDSMFGVTNATGDEFDFWSRSSNGRRRNACV